MDEVNDLQSEIIIRQRLENKMSGRFILYRSGENDVETSLVVKIRDTDHVNGFLSVRTEKQHDLTAGIDIKYRGNDDLDSYIEAIAADFLEATIEVRPHNRLFGKFELLEAPRAEVQLPPLADASTRSRPDLQTINYGDTKSMLTGKNAEESFESFVSFGELKDRIPDLKFIESAKLRLYYINLPTGANLELHQPNTLWREMGITYANKPYSIELLSDQYTQNTKERYIEFDLLEVANRWQTEDLLNYGFIIKTSYDETLSFFTRESDRSPLLIVQYITSQVYSIGRSQLDASMFVYGKGHKEITGYLTVHSDVGFDWLESTLYVHRLEDPLFYELDSSIATSRRDLISEFIVARRERDYLEASLTVATNTTTKIESNLTTNKPDLWSQIAIDPNASLKSTITVARIGDYPIDSTILVSRQDVVGHLTVSPYKKSIENLSAFLTVKTTKDDEIDSSISISKRELTGFISIRALGEDDLGSKIEVPFYNDQYSIIHTSVPDVAASLMVKYMNQIDSMIWVKEAEYLESNIDIRQIDELEVTLMVKQIHETPADITVSVPDLQGFLSPRVIGDDDLNVLASIRKRDVSDLNSTILIKGASNGAYYFII